MFTVHDHACMDASLSEHLSILQDCLFRLWSDNDEVGPMYRAQARVLCAALCPEGVPGVWMPSQDHEAAWSSETPPDGWSPTDGTTDKMIRKAAAFRGRVWSGSLSCLEAAAIQTRFRK